MRSFFLRPYDNNYLPCISSFDGTGEEAGAKAAAKQKGMIKCCISFVFCHRKCCNKKTNINIFFSKTILHIRRKIARQVADYQTKTSRAR